MTVSFAFFAPGIPKGQPRARAFVRKGHAAVYDPGTAEGWKGSIALAARDYLPASPYDCPIVCNLVFIFPRPARLMTKKSPDGRIPYTAKPDRDNSDKAVLDCLTGIGMWRDDALVYDGRITKFYAAKGERTGAHIQIIAEE